MYKHILIPTDGSELAGKAIKQGADLAKCLGAKVTILTVTSPFHIFAGEAMMVEYTLTEYTKDSQAAAAKLLAAAADKAKAGGVACETVQVEYEHVYQAII